MRGEGNARIVEASEWKEARICRSARSSWSISAWSWSRRNSRRRRNGRWRGCGWNARATIRPRRSRRPRIPRSLLLVTPKSSSGYSSHPEDAIHASLSSSTVRSAAKYFSRHARFFFSFFLCHTEVWQLDVSFFADTSPTSGDGVNEDWWSGIACGCTRGSRSASRICSRNSRAKRFARTLLLADWIEYQAVSVFHPRRRVWWAEISKEKKILKIKKCTELK